MPASPTLDFRPGHRVWPSLPAPADTVLGEDLLLEVLSAHGAQVVPLLQEEDLLNVMAGWVGPDEWALYLDIGLDTAPTGWFKWLRDRLALRLYRLTALSASDLPQYLTGKPELKVVLLPHASPLTGEALDIEELFFTVKRLRPDVLTVADVSYSIGLMPYYHTAWQADVTLIRREPFGAYLIGAEQHIPAYTLRDSMRPAFMPYLQHMQRAGKAPLWNAVHAEALTLETTLAELGVTPAQQVRTSAFTTWQMPPAVDLKAFSDALWKLHGCRIGVGETVHRDPCLLVQHAPADVAPMQRLTAALRAEWPT